MPFNKLQTAILAMCFFSLSLVQGNLLAMQNAAEERAARAGASKKAEIVCPPTFQCGTSITVDSTKYPGTTTSVATITSYTTQNLTNTVTSTELVLVTPIVRNDGVCQFEKVVEAKENFTVAIQSVTVMTVRSWYTSTVQEKSTVYGTTVGNLQCVATGAPGLATGPGSASGPAGPGIVPGSGADAPRNDSGSPPQDEDDEDEPLDPRNPIRAAADAVLGNKDEL